MGIDASIPLQVKPFQQPNMLAQYAQIEGIKNAQQQNQLGQMQMRQVERGMADEDATRGVLSDPNLAQGDMSNALLRRGLIGPAMQLQKQELEKKKQLAAIGKDEAEMNLKHLGILSSAVAGAKTSAEFAEGLLAAKAAGVPETLVQQFAANAPKNDLTMPAYTGRIAQLTKQGTDAMKLRLADFKDVGGQLLDMNPMSPTYGQVVQKTAAPEAPSVVANRALIPDGKGGFMVNQPLIDTKKAVAKSGASNVSVRIDNKTGESLAKEVGSIVSESRNTALGAIDAVGTAERIESALASGNVSAGPTATLRLKGAQIADLLGVAGKDTQEKLANTRQVIKGLAELTIAARKGLKGQGQVSDYEGRLLQRAASGEIDDLTVTEIKTITGITRRLAEQSYKLHERNMKTLKDNPNYKELADFYSVPPLKPQAPEAPKVKKISSDAEYDSLPAGAQFIAPDGTTRRKP